MVIRTAGNQLNPALQKPVCQSLRIADDLPAVLLELRLQRLAQAHRLCGDDVHQRAALGTGENGLVDLLGKFFPAENHAAPGTAQRLVGGGGDHFRIGHRILVAAGGHQTGNVGHIHHEIGAAGIANLPEFLEINGSGVGAGACHDHLGLDLHSLFHQLIIINTARFRVYAISHKMIQRARHIDRRTVGEMSALRQIHAHDRVAWLKQRKVNGQIGLRTGVRLYVGMLGAEQFTRSLPGDVLYDVHALAAAIITLSRISLRIFVGEHSAHGGHHRRRYNILRGNQLDVSLLAGKFLLHGFAHSLILTCHEANGIHQIVKHL